MTTFIYGFPPSIEDAPLISTSELDQLVGSNSGNLAFCYALWRQLGGVPTKMWLEEKSQYFQKGNTAVMALANQIGSHADMGFFADALEKNPVNLVGVGLGAQASIDGEVQIPEGTQRWLKLIQERRPSDFPNLGLRGDFTQNALKKIGLHENTEVLGCPTLFISPEKYLGKVIKKKWNKKISSIAVAAGHPSWSGLAKIEHSLCKILDGGSDYITQSPKLMLEFGRGCDTSILDSDLESIRNYCMPNMNLDQFKMWGIKHAVTFFSAPAWMEHLKRFDFVIGTRIHGVMLALQVGVPGICIAHDSRTKELCETMHVPMIEAKYILNGFSIKEFRDFVKFDDKLFDENRANLGFKYSEFMKNNKIQISKINNYFK